MPKEIAAVFMFSSESTAGKVYQAIQYVDGSTSCDCFGWTRRNPPGGRNCRHTRLIDSGLANQHAAKVVEYSTPARRTPQRAMPQPSFSRPSGRRLELGDE